MEVVTTEGKNTALKGRMVSITALVICSADLKQIDNLLKEKVKIAPAFFNGAPLLLDLENLEEEVDVNWFGQVSEIIVERGFVPVGIVGADDSLENIARSAMIPVWPSGGTPKNTFSQKDEKQSAGSVKLLISERIMQEPEQGSTVVQEESKNPEIQDSIEAMTESEKSDARHAPTMVLKSPVRSGQSVYAKDGDLIVLSSVNTGSEVMADGHIHVYGALRGRALAGVKGNREARIFCHSLQADLIAIAGYYLTNEDLPPDKRDSAVQISLLQEHLNIDTL